MSLSIFRGPVRRAARTDCRPQASSRKRVPTLDGLESRLVLSAAAPQVPPVPAGPPVHVAPAHHASANLLDFAVTGVSVVNNNGTPSLAANVSLGNASTGTVTEQVPLTFTTPAAAPAAGAATPAASPTASILDLHLAPIDLDLLGLDLQTSEICLSITAQKGGGLLGDLLYGLDNLGSSGSLTSTLSTDLTNLLNGVLSSLTAVGHPQPGGPAAATPAAAPAGSTDLLDLTLGPVNLDLLGLDVALNNCSGGPVTVNLYAIPTGAGSATDPGGLLGSLLSGLDHALAPGGIQSLI